MTLHQIAFKAAEAAVRDRDPLDTRTLEIIVEVVLKVIKQWRPIASAPKDSQPVLLREPTGLVHIGYWLIHTAASPCWWVAAGYTIFPTHWMPLPEAVSSQAERTERTEEKELMRVPTIRESSEGLTSASITEPRTTCQLCGEPMPHGEEMFNYHGYSSPCPQKQLGALTVAETQTLLGSDRPTSIGKVATDPIGLRTLASQVGYHGNQPLSDSEPVGTERSEKDQPIKSVSVSLEEIETQLAIIREHLGPAHLYDDEAGEAYCDWCNLRTPNHRDTCQWLKAKTALDSIEKSIQVVQAHAAQQRVADFNLGWESARAAIIWGCSTESVREEYEKALARFLEPR